MAIKKIIVLTRYEYKGASSRLRFFQYFPFLSLEHITTISQALISNLMLARLYRVGGYSLISYVKSYFLRAFFLLRLDKSSLIWIEKELFPWAPYFVEKLFLRNTKYILDYDDAVFHNYDMHPNKFIRYLYGRKLDALMSGACLVVCGNEYLAKRAKAAGAALIQITPTVIDLSRYKIPIKQFSPCVDFHSPVRIVWVGTPSTAKYLQSIERSLQILAKTHNFILRVIGASNFEIPGVAIEFVEWSEETEFENIFACDIGIMPLLNTPWELGKCGYKLIQYMASGLPVVASRIGVNSQIVISGVNGYLVDSPSGWTKSLGELLDDKGMRIKMGLAGRKAVEREFNIQKQGPAFVHLVRSIAIK